MNEDNWPVNAVYENRGEQIGHYEISEITGSYDIINHGTATSGKMLETKKIEICTGGSVTGDLTGTWKKTTGTNKEYDYITLSIDGVTYKGILFRQWNEKDTPEQVMTFSAIGDDNTCLWGTHRTAEDDRLDAEALAAQATPTPSPTSTPALSENQAPTQTPAIEPEITSTPQEKLVKGQKTSRKGVTYKVTNVKKKEVSVVKGKNRKSVVIPATIKVNGIRCKVTSISAKAFYKCKKLKNVTIKSKRLKKIGRKAFYGIAKKAIFKVPRGKKKAYKKMLNKKVGIMKKMKMKIK